jgi:hypothetical protein
MSAAALEGALRAAVAEGLLAPGTAVPSQDERPWPVVLLTALGAWLAAIPLIGLFGLLLADAMRHGVATYLGGVLLLGATIYALRRRDLSLFVEQLLTPALIVGAGLLAWGLLRDLPTPAACAVLAVVAVASAVLIPRPWLRVVLGAAAAALAALTWLPWKGEPR